VETFIAVAGFLGAWLLVAGPVYQAALELAEEATENPKSVSREELIARVPAPPRISPWWWLLPPVGYVLNRRRSTQWREQMLTLMQPEDMRHMIEFSRKATGWLLVATGGFAIALKETWELGEHFEWPTAIFWTLVVVMALICFGYTVGNLRRSERMLRDPAGIGQSNSRR
jgi:hypothetical protein